METTSNITNNNFVSYVLPSDIISSPGSSLNTKYCANVINVIPKIEMTVNKIDTIIPILY